MLSFPAMDRWALFPVSLLTHLSREVQSKERRVEKSATVSSNAPLCLNSIRKEL